jgi:hypothetical protein
MRTWFNCIERAPTSLGSSSVEYKKCICCNYYGIKTRKQNDSQMLLNQLGVVFIFPSLRYWRSHHSQKTSLDHHSFLFRSSFFAVFFVCSRCFSFLSFINTLFAFSNIKCPSKTVPPFPPPPPTPKMVPF